MKEKNSSLLLVWKHPETRCRYAVGRFVELGAFPPGKEWTARELHPFFQRRLPIGWSKEGYPPLGLKSDVPLEFFRLTGGRLQTDTFELLEPFQSEDSTGRYELRFPIAGFRYYQGEVAIHELEPGTNLQLALEASNKYDPNAIRILSPGGTLLGYVPAIYSWYVEHSVRVADYVAMVESLGSKDDPQVRVMVRLSGAAGTDLAVRIPAGLSEYAQTVTTGIR